MKYIFRAHYKDGTFYQQNLEDKSIIDPERRSCFYDINHDKLNYFELFNDLEEKTYIVNLINGEIIIKIKDQIMRIPPPKEKLNNFRIIYFRRKEIGINYFFENERGEVSSEKVLYYILGWQANTENGENKQFIMEIE